MSLFLGRHPRRSRECRGSRSRRLRLPNLALCLRQSAVLESGSTGLHEGIRGRQGTAGKVDNEATDLVREYGHFFRAVHIQVDQEHLENRLLATEAIGALAALTGRRVSSLRLSFVGKNPLFYAGQEFLDAILHFHRAPLDEPGSKFLRTVDMSEIPIALTDDFILSLEQHFPTLRFVDVQNEQLVSQISPEAMGTLIANAPFLADLRTLRSSLSPAALTPFAQSRTGALRHVSIICQRQDKYRAKEAEIPAELWAAIAVANPQLRVTLRFDHSCPIWKIRQILKPTIPVQNLYLETYDVIFDEIRLATSFYASTLQKLVVQTLASTELSKAVLELASACPHMESLHIMCTLPPTVIDFVLDKFPKMARHPTRYTLKSAMEACPWALNRDLDDIREQWSE